MSGMRSFTRARPSRLCSYARALRAPARRFLCRGPPIHEHEHEPKVARDLPAYDSSVFYGVWKEDLKDLETDLRFENLRGLRQRAKECVLNRDSREFVHLAHEAAQELPLLPRDHRFYFPSHLLFIRDPSPFADVFALTMKKIFHKACDSTLSDRKTQPANCSGYAISGPRGVGKTNGLRLCSILAPLLLENVVSVYVDSQAHPSTTPLELLEGAFSAAGVDIVTNGGDINTLCGRAALRGYAVMVCIDELRNIYKNTQYWTQLHSIANRYNTALFVADSTSRLQALIEGEKNEHFAKLTQRWYGVTQPSLNSTKLSMVLLHPFNNNEQYKKYYEDRRDKKYEDRWTEENIQGFHTLTGGRMRTMMAMLTDVKEYAAVGGPRGANRPFPGKGTVARYILDHMRRTDRQRGGHFDPFQLPVISQTECIRLIEQAGAQTDLQAEEVSLARTNPMNVLHDLQTSDILTIKPSGDLWEDVQRNDTLLTFSSPYLYLFLLDLSPKVVISHAMKDESDAKELARLLTILGVDVHICEQPDSKVKMAEIGTQQWMKQQVELWDTETRKPNKFCIILLSDSYVDKVNDALKLNGCKFEVEQLLEQMSQVGSTIRKQLFFVRVRGFQRRRLEESPLLKALAQDSKSPENSSFIFNLCDQEDLAALVSGIFGSLKPEG